MAEQVATTTADVTTLVTEKVAATTEEKPKLTVENNVEVAASAKSGESELTSKVAVEKIEELKSAEASDIGSAAETVTAATEDPKTEEAGPNVPKGCRKTDFVPDVVYLFQFGRTPVLPSVSPYCLKVETWMRLANVTYENVDHKMKYRSKKGLLPFVEVNGEEIADSATIIKELGVRFDKDLDKSLDSNQRNLSHAMISMVENGLTWVINWWKAKHTDNMLHGYKMNLQEFLGTRFPGGILNFFFKYNYSRKGLKKAKAQGIGFFSEEEIYEKGGNDLKVLSETLGDKPFFFGDEPTLLDVVVFANLAQIYFVDKSVEFKVRDILVDNYQNLVELVIRMKEKCFPDWDEICSTSEPETLKTTEEEKLIVEEANGEFTLLEELKEETGSDGAVVAIQNGGGGDEPPASDEVAKEEVADGAAKDGKDAKE